MKCSVPSNASVRVNNLDYVTSKTNDDIILITLKDGERIV